MSRSECMSDRLKGNPAEDNELSESGSLKLPDICLKCNSLELLDTCLKSIYHTN